MVRFGVLKKYSASIKWVGKKLWFSWNMSLRRGSQVKVISVQQSQCLLHGWNDPKTLKKKGNALYILNIEYWSAEYTPQVTSTTAEPNNDHHHHHITSHSHTCTFTQNTHTQAVFQVFYCCLWITYGYPKVKCSPYILLWIYGFEPQMTTNQQRISCSQNWPRTDKSQ